MKLLPKISKPRYSSSDPKEIERDLIRTEAKIGGSLFPDNNRYREFFCLDEYTWIWHEEWTEKGKHHVMTTRYEVSPNGILKSVNGQSYKRLTINEAQNLFQATELYHQQVSQAYQRLLQTN